MEALFNPDTSPLHAGSQVKVSAIIRFQRREVAPVTELQFPPDSPSVFDHRGLFLHRFLCTRGKGIVVPRSGTHGRQPGLPMNPGKESLYTSNFFTSICCAAPSILYSISSLHLLRVARCIVSIRQPWIRPIVRGKTNALIELEAKVAIRMVDGYAQIDKLCLLYNKSTTKNRVNSLKKYWEIP